MGHSYITIADVEGEGAREMLILVLKVRRNYPYVGGGGSKNPQNLLT